MMLELRNVTIGKQISALSLVVEDGQLVTVTGPSGSGKSLLVRAVMGLIPVDDGFISIDGELMTPMSAFYFRHQMAYVPQHLTMPEGYQVEGLERWNELSEDERYLLLLNKAIQSGKQMIIIDEPAQPLSVETENEVVRLLLDAEQQGKTILAVNGRITRNQVNL